MKNWHFIIFVSFFLSLTTGDAFACGSGKKCCKKEMSTKQTKKKCCGTGDHSKNNHSGCNGKCGHSSCVNPIVNFAAIPNSNAISTNNSEIFSAKKQLFFYKQPRLTSGYYTIWLIPKISLS